MTAEAIARLRDAARGTRGQTLLLGDVIVNANDLRALLDAHAALKAAHTEALDALEGLRATIRVEPTMDGAYRNATLNYPRAEVGAWCKRTDAVLAKAGRR